MASGVMRVAGAEVKRLSMGDQIAYAEGTSGRILTIYKIETTGANGWPDGRYASKKAADGAE